MSLVNCTKQSGGVRFQRALQLLGVMFGVLLLCTPAFSQGSTGRILGTITDTSGGVVSGATISVVDTERGVARTLTTDDAGAYNAPNLTPSSYTVRAEAKGFKKIERQNIVLETGHEVRIDLTVQPGEQAQTITITEAVPLVETTNATLGGTLETADIADLPLNGRDYQNLLALRPGVQLYPGGGPWTQSANGARPDESVWMIDGIINVNPFDARPLAGMPSPFTDGATILPVDAIQEFNLMENPKAEYGWKTGAVVNVGIKSGTNTLHGSAYAFGRTDSWDARNYYNVLPNSDGSCVLGDPAFCKKTPIQLKQYGGVAGGKIKKDKLFYFGGYEGLRDIISVPFSIPVPATAHIPGGDTTNSMVDAINAVNAAGLTPSTVSEKLICPNAVSQPLPLPSTFVCAGGLTPATGTSTNFLSAFPIINQSDNGIGKMDYHMNDKNQIFGTFYYGHYDAVGEDRPFTNAAFEDTSPIRVWTNVESWVYTPNSRVVNEMRFGYDHMSFDFVNVDINKKADGNGYPINTGITDPHVGGMPTINVFGFASGGAQMLGTNFNRPQNNDGNPYYDFQDSISWLRGKHAFKFGGEFSHLEADTATYADGRGFINFNGGVAFGGSTPLEDYFAGKPTNGQLLVGNAFRAATWMLTAGYIQDDFRATPKLMINIGLRYEYVSPMQMKGNLWASFDPQLGMVQQGSGLSSLYKPDHTGFEPRLGFAWDINGKGTTVVRGGGSLIKTSFPLNTFLGPVGLQNDNAANPSAIPTAATLFCTPVGLGQSACPATAGGTNPLQVSNLKGSSLNWNAPPGPVGVFPSAATTCGDGAFGRPQSPCDIMSFDPNLRSPFVVNYNLSITHMIGSNLSIEVGYVGNHGYRLLNFADINQAPLGAASCLNSPLTTAQIADGCNLALMAPNIGSPIQEARPFYTKFPYLGFINEITNRSHSRYDSLQVSITKRMSHGLSFNTGYTYAHGFDNASLNRFGGLPQDSRNPNLEFGSSDTDLRHRLTFTATYNIPGIKGFGQILEGWQINTIATYQTPQPWTAYDNGDNISGTGENADRWNIVGDPLNFPVGPNSSPRCTGFPSTVTCTVTNPYGSVTTPATSAQSSGCTAAAPSAATLASFGCYVSPNGKSFIVPPAPGTFGNMGRNIFYDAGFKNLDMSIFKNFKFKERYGVQFRWEVFNAFNHPNFVNPSDSSGWLNSGNILGSGGFGAPGLTPDVGAGNPLIGGGSQRVMQMGLKLSF